MQILVQMRVQRTQQLRRQVLRAEQMWPRVEQWPLYVRLARLRPGYGHLPGTEETAHALGKGPLEVWAVF